MLTTIDRLTIYSVLCFVSFCILVLNIPAEAKLAPLFGMMATLAAIWVEMRRWSTSSDD